MKETREALSCIKKNDETFFLIPKSARILIPISKNDHSLFLYECLKRYALYAQKDFELIPVCFRFEESDEAISGFPLLEHLEIEQERLARELASRSYESYVSKLKRLAYANEASAHGCSIIALPTSFEDFFFHYEDNLLRLGKINSYLPYSLASNNCSFIRPLFSFDEEKMKKGEEELGISACGQVRESPLSKNEKDSFLKATCYGESSPNLPSLSKREILADYPELYFEKGENGEIEIKDRFGIEMASFKVSELDAHRFLLSSFYFTDEVEKAKILSSFFAYWKKRKKLPLQFCIDVSEDFNFDSSWKLIGDAYVKKFW